MRSNVEGLVSLWNLSECTHKQHYHRTLNMHMSVPKLLFVVGGVGVHECVFHPVSEQLDVVLVNPGGGAERNNRWV